MTDDDRLAELFRTAASDAGAPSPGFDHGEVVAASRRITARRRTALTGALGVVAVIGISVAVVLPERSFDATAAAPAVAPDSAQRAEAGSPAAADQAAAPAPPLGPGLTPCADQQDPALRALVEQALPEVAGARPAATTDECRQAGERGVSVEVGGGVLTVRYLAPGVAATAPPGAAAAPTASGGTVIVSSGPGRSGGPVPFAGRLGAAAAFLAERL